MIVDRGKAHQTVGNCRAGESAAAETAVRSRWPASDNPTLSPRTQCARLRLELTEGTQSATGAVRFRCFAERQRRLRLVASADSVRLCSAGLVTTARRECHRIGVPYGIADLTD